MISVEQEAAIFSVVSKEYGISKELILSKEHNVRIIKARRLIIRICEEILGLSYEETAILLGKTERTTIIHYKNYKHNEKGEVEDDI